MTQIAAETLGLPMDNVTFKLGDSSLPQAPVEGGSLTAATVGSAVKAVCEKVREQLFDLAQKRKSRRLPPRNWKTLHLPTGTSDSAAMPREPCRLSTRCGTAESP